MSTGLKAIDALHPGRPRPRRADHRGSPDRQERIVLDTFLNTSRSMKRRRNQKLYCGLCRRRPEAFHGRAVREGMEGRVALEYSIINRSRRFRSGPPMQFLGLPFTGCAMGEYFPRQRHACRIAYDDCPSRPWPTPDVAPAASSARPRKPIPATSLLHLPCASSVRPS